MKQMTMTFAHEIRNKVGQDREKRVFNTIYKSLAKVYGEQNVDLEAIMSVIAGLKEKEHIKENIGDLGLFVLERKGITNYANWFKCRTDVLDNLEDEFKKHIRNKVVIHDPMKIDLAREVYLDFFKHLCVFTNCDNVNAQDSDPYKYTHSKWTFFTTNYDNIIEDFWVKGREYTELNLGFEQRKAKKIMYADRFLHNNTNDANYNAAMQLVKLHGSINWIKDKDRAIEEHRYHLSFDDVRSTSGPKDIQEDILIYPLSQKQLYFTPFVQLFRILDAELEKRNLWIVIGYSFRDIVIRTMFERALAANHSRKILLIHPHATKQIKPLFQEQVQNQLKCMDTYFARENYTSVNKEIAEVLLDLANA